MRSHRPPRSFANALSLAAVALVTLAGCDDTPRGLMRSQIEQTTNDRGPSLTSCWKAKGPHGELKLHVAITTSPDGHVESATADSKDATVNACIEKQVKTWTFPKVAAATKFSLPVNLKR
jgi:hypothetical protein